MVGRKKGWLTYRGKFAGLKSGGTVLWKSLLVRDYLYLLEYDRDVLTYGNCHVEVNYTHSGESHVLRPDLSVRRAGSLQLIRLVNGKELSDSGAASRLTVLPDRVEGHDLSILTEVDVRRQPFLNNVKVLWRYARVPVEAAQYQLLCIEFFECTNCATLGELIEFFVRRRLSASEVFALIFRGILSADMTTPLTPRSPVSYPGAGAALKKGA